MKTPITISATDLNRRSGELLKRVVVDGEHFLIERNGYPLAVIIPLEVYRRSVSGEHNHPSEQQ